MKQTRLTWKGVREILGTGFIFYLAALSDIFILETGFIFYLAALSDIYILETGFIFYLAALSDTYIDTIYM